MDSPDLALAPDGTVIVVFTDDHTVGFGWICDDGPRYEIPDGGHGVESTSRGQPSLFVDAATDTVQVVYTRRKLDQTMEIRLATRAMPSCEATQ